MKKGASLLWNAEQHFIGWMVPRVPRIFDGYNLTLMSIIWSGLIIIFSYFAQFDMHWLWVVSFAIACQWFTDSLDGAVGRYRGSGLVRWGFYMDHFLDYIFLCSILIGYSFIVTEESRFILFFILAIFGAFIVNSYLAFGSTNEFKIEYLKIGPTEVRILFIIINTLLIFFGRTYMAGALPYVLIFSLIGLTVVVWKTQRYIWQLDMKALKKKKQQK